MVVNNLTFHEDHLFPIFPSYSGATFVRCCISQEVYKYFFVHGWKCIADIRFKTLINVVALKLASNVMLRATSEIFVLSVAAEAYLFVADFRCYI